jgi:hypothetical protein
MGYVALSRVRSLDGIYLSGMNQMAMRLHPDIFDFDAELRAASELIAAEAADALEESEDSEPEAPQINDELLMKLKTWRMKRAVSDGVPAYFIAHDRTLQELCSRPPANQHQILATKGFGPAKAEKYGPDILAITKDYAEAADNETANNEVSDYGSWKAAQEDKAKDLLKELTNPVVLEDDSSDSNSPSDWMQRYRDELKSRYSRTSQRWTPEEDARLIGLFNSGATLGQVCDTLQRPPGGVWARLVGLIGEKAKTSVANQNPPF